MKKYTGKSISSGLAIGEIYISSKLSLCVNRVNIIDTEAEINRFYQCKDKAIEQLKELYKKAVSQVGQEGASIFEAHQMMIDNEDYLNSVENIINEEMVNAEYAIATTCDRFASMFINMDDEYMKARAADVKEISDRLLKILNGNEISLSEVKEPVILVADELSAGEIVQMDKSKIKALITTKGSVNSHAAILIRMMNIPAVIINDLKLAELNKNSRAIVDGDLSLVIIDPDENEIKDAKARIKNQMDKKTLLDELKGKPTITRSGREIRLYANIGNVSDVKAVLENDAEGIGLMRSEFLFIGRKESPSEEEQFQAYKEILEAMGSKKVIIRTLDLGADKEAEYLNLKREDNPALGLRGIRLCLSRPEIFKTQLRALFRASIYGNLSIMYPMITSVEEVLKIKDIVAEVKCELDKEEISYINVEEGIMIETPAAVMVSDELAKLVDFFSVGTNDLTQYALAADRYNSNLEGIYDPQHKAIIKMIKMAADNAHKEGKWIGICGEMGAQLELIETFIEMGIDELSVSPAMILPIRKKINE